MLLMQIMGKQSKTLSESDGGGYWQKKINFKTIKLTFFGPPGPKLSIFRHRSNQAHNQEILRKS